MSNFPPAKPVDELSPEEAQAELRSLEQILPESEKLVEGLVQAHDIHVATVEMAATELDAEMSAIESHAARAESELQKQILNAQAQA